MPAALFDQLDLNRDGFLSRDELSRAAQQLGWSWREAPFYAVLDLLSIPNPIAKPEFIAYLEQIHSDPLGPYGEVLRHAAPIYHQITQPCRRSPGSILPPSDRLCRFLEGHVGSAVADRYRQLLESLEPTKVSSQKVAALIIDPQRSFTQGAWMQPIGPQDVTPIRLAFDNCARLLQGLYGHADIMFTRCPFPADSYDWDSRIAEVVEQAQPYFIKPGNNVLFPPLNGFEDWVRRFIERGKKMLVIGGCTLNSCVRVSAVQTQTKFKENDLQVVVDLTLCGARARNYIRSSEFGGRSAIESAVEQMQEAGVRVVPNIDWVGF